MYARQLGGLIGALLFFSTSAAVAQDAYTVRAVHVRAGPNRGYPIVAQLPPGAAVQVQGCLNDWSWCEVTFDDTAGWTYAPGLSYAYQGAQVPLYSYAPSLGIPVVTFSLDAFWGQYYRGKPFYGQRAQWAQRSFPPHLRPPSAPHAGPPPAPRGGRPGGFAAPARPGNAPHAAPQRERSERPAAQRPNGAHAAPGRGPSEHGPQGRDQSERRPDEPH
ncbi:MAG TPA: SH3 domain-containing protein [Steroidobacteraceae bacterium]|nr:SH3 domain-containing protein [Steroidobacteraceae bacterium]